MMHWLWILLLFGTPATLLAADWQLQPTELGPGGVARLSWHGPARQVRARFLNEEIPLTRSGESWSTLLGLDLEAKPGDYPITLAVEDAAGATAYYGMRLVLKRPPRTGRPAEKLKLPKRYVTPEQPEILARLAQERTMLAQLYTGRSAMEEAPGFVRPVPGAVVSPFGRGRLLNGANRSRHAGVDFSGAPGTPVAAAGHGRVVFAGDLYLTGQTVILDHGDGLFTIYAHLQHIDCSLGANLAPGAPVGALGSSGRATGPHLHWGAKLRGARIDPLALLAVAPGKSVDGSASRRQ